ncbi:MAG: sugar kinase [Chloroflexi bacterium]|nr:sugar kinase [Chloroflexota bacterium]
MAFEFDILRDDLTGLGRGPAFVAFGETMVRDMPADNQRPERTQQVWLSMAGSELTLAVTLSRLGVPSSYITRVPDNPYGWMLRNLAREQGLDTAHFVWADRADLMGRFMYELGRSPRPGTVWYQRKHSAASQLGAGMVDWGAALREARLFHTSGITFALANHSGYPRNHLLEAFQEAAAAKPAGCLVGLDFNYRSTLWSVAQCKAALTPVLTDHVDVLITTIEDMAGVYGMSCGRVSAAEIEKGDIGRLEDEDVRAFLQELTERFRLRVAGVTIRYPDSHEQHRWEAAAMDAQGHFFRSPAIRPIVLLDRLGGGDTWNGGFYYGLLTEPDPERALAKGVLVGDAATRLKQTLMYDLPIITKAEVQALLRADLRGGGKRTTR